MLREGTPRLPGRCSLNGGDVTSRRCTALCVDGSPCRAWAVRSSDPPRCRAHGGATRHDAATQLPEDCSIDAIIDMLYKRQIRIDALIDDVAEDDGASIRELACLLRIHGQNASRLGRLLRDRRALTGHAAQGISGAIAQALDELGSELGTPL